MAKDFAASEDPAVQAQLDRLAALSLPQGRLGLETIRELLARQLKEHGRPEQALREYQRAYHLYKARSQSAEAEAISAEIHAIDPSVDLAQATAPSTAQQHLSAYDELPGFLDEPSVAVEEPPPPPPPAAPAPPEVEPPVEVAFDGPVEAAALDLATIELEPNGNGTRVQWSMEYQMNGGYLGVLADKVLLGQAHQGRIDQGLANLRRYAETGEPANF